MFLHMAAVMERRMLILGITTNQILVVIYYKFLEQEEEEDLNSNKKQSRRMSIHVSARQHGRSFSQTGQLIWQIYRHYLK